MRPDERIIGLYERYAHDFDRERGRSLQERHWLDRFLSHVSPGGTVLDVGCGSAEPIARYIMKSGRRVVGIDSSQTLIAICRERFPVAEWLVMDMRQLGLSRRFDGILAWDSFFHLNMDDQRKMFRRLADHAAPGAPLMFTSGMSEGSVLGEYHDEPLYHASLDPEEYRRLLADNGFSVEAHVVEDPACGNHTVWLAVAARDR